MLSARALQQVESNYLSKKSLIVAYESDKKFNKMEDGELAPSTDYFYSLETQHKDFVRSMVQLGENMLLTASEDKTIKIFYF